MAMQTTAGTWAEEHDHEVCRSMGIIVVEFLYMYRKWSITIKKVVHFNFKLVKEYNCQLGACT